MLGETCPVLICPTPSPALPLHFTPSGDSGLPLPHHTPHTLPGTPHHPGPLGERPGGAQAAQSPGVPLSPSLLPQAQAPPPLLPFPCPSPLVARRARLTSICLLGLESGAAPLCRAQSPSRAAGPHLPRRVIPEGCQPHRPWGHGGEKGQCWLHPATAAAPGCWGGRHRPTKLSSP